jgi:membrane protein DedA with SNARE-associated domain
MNFDTLIGQYGYAALLAGSLLEGEAVVAVGGIVAHRGYLSLSAVIVYSAAGAYIGDMLAFAVGRWGGNYVLRRWPHLTAQADRMHALLQRHGLLLILGHRFVYGLKTTSAIAIGMSGIDWVRYGSLSAIGACLWAALIASAGYLFGAGAFSAVNAVAPMLP